MARLTILLAVLAPAGSVGAQSRPFHFVWGGSPSANQNDLLHATLTYQVAQLSALAWDRATDSPVTAGWLGAATGIGVGLAKEIRDGLRPEGFSGSTLAWESVSALIPAAHRQWPATRVLQLKAFYWPSDEYRHGRNRPSLGNDYAGMRFFMTLNPARTPGYGGAWPGWLGLALGHGTPGWLNLPGPAQHTWYATMDVDLHAIPVHTSWWKPLASVLDQVHVPAPGIRITGNRIEAGLY